MLGNVVHMCVLSHFRNFVVIWGMICTVGSFKIRLWEFSTFSFCYFFKLTQSISQFRSQLSADWVLVRRARNPANPANLKLVSGERYWEYKISSVSQFVSNEIKTKHKINFVKSKEDVENSNAAKVREFWWKISFRKWSQVLQNGHLIVVIQGTFRTIYWLAKDLD